MAERPHAGGAENKVVKALPEGETGSNWSKCGRSIADKAIAETMVQVVVGAR